MPGIIKVKIIGAKDLPIMDRASDLTDAFVELRLGTTVFKTEVYRKSLNPQWDSEWYKFEVDDEELQEEYLQLKVLDHDTYSSHDMIGKVNIILDTLVSNAGSNELNGLFPIYDTLHGIRGFIRVKVRAQFFNDMNKYRQTSCGVHFYSAVGIPSGYALSQIQGLVHELLVNDDPEYQWIDKIRTPRASNEARQRLFTKMSGEVKRKIGLKVIEMGGNAVVGYQQYFDLEGETGIVIRGIGTSATLVKENDGWNGSIISPTTIDDQHLRLTTENGINERVGQRFMVRGLSISSDVGDKPVDSPDISYLNRQPCFPRKKTCIEDLEYPFFTLFNPPNGFILHLGGMVSSRSVKLLDKINNPDEPETREMWWTEIRTEIRSHTKAMGCDAVLGYTEHTSICDDLIILSAYGTAAVIKQSLINEHSIEVNERKDTMLDNVFEGLNENEYENKRRSRVDSSNNGSSSLNSSQSENGVFDKDVNSPGCSICHVPYSEIDVQIPISLSKCSFCRQDKVPEILLATIDIPEDIPITGTGCMIQARVVRTKKKDKDEANAENISQILPFLEFDLHQQLINRLKTKGMNAIFGITSKLSIGEQAIVGVMVGTAVYLTALPEPPLLFVAGRKENKVEESNEKIVEIQKRLIEVTKKNKIFFHLKDTENLLVAKENNRIPSNNEDHQHNAHEDARTGKLDLRSDSKETYLLEIDELDVDNVASLLSDDYVEGINIFNTQATPGYPALHQDFKYISMFKSWKIPSLSQEDHSKLNQWLASLCDVMQVSLRIKVQQMMPCCLTNLYHDIKITDEDYLQITLNTFVCRVDERYQKTKAPSSRGYSRSESSHSGGANRSLDIENERDDESNPGQQLSLPVKTIEKINQKNKEISRFQPTVIISSLDHIPNSQTVQYRGNINLFLIRESTDVKEDGGFNLFMQKFMNEIHAIVRAHVLFLGGNAILSFFVNEITLFYNPHKNQTQCLVNISGDAAEIKVLPLDHYLVNDHDPISSSSSVGQSPSTNQPPELIEEIKYKLERSVYGTNV